MPAVSPLVALLAAATIAGLVLPAAAASARGSCEWRAPAHDPYTGDVPSAVDRYADIPAPTRQRLKARMAQFAYDDIVSIRRDSIEGHFRYEPVLLDMHFGKRRICGEVTRKTWTPEHEERGLAYCEDGQCVVVPLVCRNVSRIIRQPGGGATSGGPAARPEPLLFEPPSAGVQPVLAEPASPEPTARVQLAPPPATVPPTALPPLVATPPVTPGPPLAPEPAPPPVWPAPTMPPLPPAPAVPEPATTLLWMAGAAVLAWARRRSAAMKLRNKAQPNGL